MVRQTDASSPLRTWASRPHGHIESSRVKGFGVFGCLEFRVFGGFRV